MKLISHIKTGFITLITALPHCLITGIKYIFNKEEFSREKNNTPDTKLIPITIITLSLITYLLCIFILTRWYVQSERTKNYIASFTSTVIEDDDETTTDEYEEIVNSVPKEDTTDENYNYLTYINVNLDYYISKNSETVAWLQVNGTKVNYPVVQHSDNNYYLTHDFYQNQTNVGWVFADYRDNFETFNNNTIIYGHNLINKTMFGSLTNLLNTSWFETSSNHYIKLSTTTTNSIWQIFSVYKIAPTTDYLQSKFNSMTTYQEFLDLIKSRSTYNFDIEVTSTDKIITLSTCDDTGTKRVAIHAKLISIENK